MVGGTKGEGRGPRVGAGGWSGEMTVSDGVERTVCPTCMATASGRGIIKSEGQEQREGRDEEQGGCLSTVVMMVVHELPPHDSQQ